MLTDFRMQWSDSSDSRSKDWPELGDQSDERSESPHNIDEDCKIKWSAEDSADIEAMKKNRNRELCKRNANDEAYLTRIAFQLVVFSSAKEYQIFQLSR